MKRILFLFCISCFSLSMFSHTVTLTPDSGYEKVVPLSGITKVSDGMFGLAVKAGARDRIVDKNACKLRRCMIFSCDYELERGKIINITDDKIIVHVKYYFPHDVVEEDIEVLPRTFSRIMSGGYPQKIVCSFNY